MRHNSDESYRRALRAALEIPDDVSALHHLAAETLRFFGATPPAITISPMEACEAFDDAAGSARIYSEIAMRRESRLVYRDELELIVPPDQQPRAGLLRAPWSEFAGHTGIMNGEIIAIMMSWMDAPDFLDLGSRPDMAAIVYHHERPLRRPGERERRVVAAQGAFWEPIPLWMERIGAEKLREEITRARALRDKIEDAARAALGHADDTAIAYLAAQIRAALSMLPIPPYWAELDLCRRGVLAGEAMERWSKTTGGNAVVLYPVNIIGGSAYLGPVPETKTTREADAVGAQIRQWSLSRDLAEGAVIYCRSDDSPGSFAGFLSGPADEILSERQRREIESFYRR